MGNNYNFKINPRLPSSEEIQRHKDFGALLRQYKGQQESRRTRRLRRLRVVSASSAAAAAVAAIAIVLGGIFSAPNEPARTAEEYFAQQEFIKPPLAKDIQPQFASFRVDANQGGVYEYPSGSRLVVPAAAFADDRGRLIEGEVDIRYREMHDYVDFFLSGVPLTYDSAGVKYHLESAGMIEIYAEQDGKRVQLAPGKNIDVELVSEIIVSSFNLNVPPRYHVYQLDTFSREWLYQDVDNIQFIEDEILEESDPLFQYKKELLSSYDAIESRVAEQLRALESSIPKPVEPLRPQRAAPGRPTLELNFLDGSLNVEDTQNGEVQDELAKLQRMYKGVIWQISPSSPAFDERAFNVSWQSVRIRPANNRDYELTLIHPQNQVTLIVSPVLMGSDYEAALQRYEGEYQAYEAARAEWEARLKEQKQALLGEAEREKAEALKAYDHKLDELRASGLEFGNATRYLVKRKVVNRFKATGFGFWNCDRLIPPAEQRVQAAFRDQHGNFYRNHTAYLVDRSENTVYRLYATDKTPLHFDANSENLLWIVTDDHKIAVARPEDFARINPEKNAYTLQLKLIDKEILNEEDVRAILQF
ncbi:MAG: hypothetical protein H6557_27805 [Lewinellaceae bacterium]|nr:hypothetical protein [Phaeodactylibacter sp.]MCB9040448.1 hypothetical protein [Lewinellaceae bacterium]